MSDSLVILKVLLKLFNSKLPETCEVNSPDIHDVLLADDYTELPNLTCVLSLRNLHIG